MVFIADRLHPLVMLMASPLICKLTPLPPTVEGPAGAFLPAPVGAGSAPTPERAWLTLELIKSSGAMPAVVYTICGAMHGSARHRFGARHRAI